MKTFVGTCVNSFDEDGNCVISELPWNDVTDFAISEENSIELSKKIFNQFVSVDDSILKIIGKHKKKYLKTDDDVYMIYDEYTDIHYFFN